MKYRGFVITVLAVALTVGGFASAFANGFPPALGQDSYAAIQANGGSGVSIAVSEKSFAPALGQDSYAAIQANGGTGASLSEVAVQWPPLLGQDSYAAIREGNVTGLAGR